MPYSSALRHAIGAVSATLTQYDCAVHDPRFREHGHHEIAADAPLILVACSGGRDSLALAALSHIVCNMWGMRCGAVIVNHHMQEGSSAVAERTAQLCTELGLDPVQICNVEVHADERGSEAAARDARYQALVATARQYHALAVLLAHTMDDQAESVLIDLMRAAGTDAMAGMPAMQTVDGVRFLRPLLNVSRAQTTRICEELQLKYWDDPTNGDHIPADIALPNTFPLRSRVRHTLLPFFNDFAGCDMTQRLAVGAQIARRDVDFLNESAQAAYEQYVRIQSDGIEIDARGLASTHEAIRFRVIALALAQRVAGCSSRHITQVEALISAWHGQGSIALPRKYSAFRKGHVIRVCEDKSHANRRRARQD